MSQPSLAELCYTAYHDQLAPGTPLLAWGDLASVDQKIWQQVAEQARSSLEQAIAPKLQEIESHANTMNGAALVKDLNTIGESNFQISRRCAEISDLLSGYQDSDDDQA